jgi:phospholipase A1/A2
MPGFGHRRSGRFVGQGQLGTITCFRPLLAALWLVAVAARAQGPVPPNPCLSLSDDTERLACHDSRAGSEAMVSLPGRTSQASASASASAGSDSHLGRYWELEDADKRGTFNYTAYRANYFLPLRVMSRVHRTPSSPSLGTAQTLPIYQHAEAKLQLSMRSKVMQDALLPGADIWVAYTQQSMWQIWNQAASAPFRSTDFQPEVIYILPTPAFLQQGPWGWSWHLTELGLVHQSNGQSGALSRSWNRIYASVGIERGGLTAALRFEQRLTQRSSQSDDNPDIAAHLGRVDTQLTWSPGHATATLAWRPSLRGRGSWQLDWTCPVQRDRPDGLRWYAQAFQGFGETLLDYNIRQASLGFGLTLFKF